MTDPQIEQRYPLAWPEGRPRKRGDDRRPALFRSEGRPMTFTSSRQRLKQQVEAMTIRGRPWRVTKMVLSTNICFTLAGKRDRNVSQREPADPGVAFYFDLDRRPHVLACDQWETVYDNIAAIAAHIEALRGQERWGVADLRQAFAGHVALPAPDPWWAVLEVARDANRAVVDAAYRAKARTAHPNAGGDRAGWDRLSNAYEAAKREKS